MERRLYMKKSGAAMFISVFDILREEGKWVSDVLN